VSGDSRRLDLEGELAERAFNSVADRATYTIGGETYQRTDAPPRGDDEALWYQRESDGALFEVEIWTNVRLYREPK
jgi:hypothetical protein